MPTDAVPLRRRVRPPDRLGPAAFFATLVRLLPLKVGGTLSLMVCVGLLEWVGLMLLVPLLGLVGVDLGGGAASRIARAVGAGLAGVGVAPTLVTVLAVYVGMVSGRAFLQRWQSLAVTDLQSGLVRHLRQRLFRAVLNTRWVFFARQRSSDPLHVLTAQIDRVGYAADHLLPLIAQALLASVYVLFALTLSPGVTLLVVGSGSGLLLLLRHTALRAAAIGERHSAVTRRLYATVTEQLSGLKTARSYGAEARTLALFDGVQDEVVATHMEAQRTFTAARCGFQVGSVLTLGVVMYVAVGMLRLAAAEVLLLVFLFGRVVPRLSGIQQSYHYFVSALPAFRDVMGLIERYEREAEVRAADAAMPRPLREALRMRKVSFRYRSDAAMPTISELDLVVPAHRTTAIVGPSGAGKSTIADLALGLVTPDQGQVLVDDVPLGPKTLHAWRAQVGYVPQETFLFHDTIRANILWARPDASEDRLRAALALAAADRFVLRLPAGLDTVIGDRGLLLSGGERQRLALARALVRDPMLLVLDEATSSLDSEAERQIQRAIEDLHGRMTILWITHRLSTIREADAIHVIEDGRLVESGTWTGLVTAGGRFAALCRAQRIATPPAVRDGSLVAMGAG